MITVVTGTSTGVGKTIATAALAARALAAGERVLVVKPAQTGTVAEDGGEGDSDAREVARLAGCEVQEWTTLAEPLAPDTAARRAGVAIPPVREYAERLLTLSRTYDRVIVEGAGGLLVRLDTAGGTLLDLAAMTSGAESAFGNSAASAASSGVRHGKAEEGAMPEAWRPTTTRPGRALGGAEPALPSSRTRSETTEVVIVCSAGLGTLNHTELTVAALRGRGIEPAGLVIGSWPAQPGLAESCNLDDLPRTSGVPLLAVVPEGAGRLDPAAFRASAPQWLRTAPLP